MIGTGLIINGKPFNLQPLSEKKNVEFTLYLTEKFIQELKDKAEKDRLELHLYIEKIIRIGLVTHNIVGEKTDKLD